MKSYIFLQTFWEYNNEDEMLEQSNFLWIVSWENEKEAFKNLRKQFDYLWCSWDEENYICFELISDKYKTFTLR